jgi:hypothetical protein
MLLSNDAKGQAGKGQWLFSKFPKSEGYLETPGVNARGFGSLGNDNYTPQAHVEESTYEQETGR